MSAAAVSIVVDEGPKDAPIPADDISSEENSGEDSGEEGEEIDLVPTDDTEHGVLCVKSNAKSHVWKEFKYFFSK